MVHRTIQGMACSDHDTPFEARACGVSFAVDIAAVQESSPAGNQLREQLLSVLVAGHAAALVVTGIERCDVPEDAFDQLGTFLSQVLHASGALATNLHLVVDNAGLPPAAAWSIRCSKLGAGPLFLRLRDVPPHYWSALWQLRSNALLRPVYATTVTSRCRLLSAEPACAVLPGLDVQAPVGSAWIAMRLDVAQYTSWRALEADLRNAVDAGERLHESAQWPTARMRHDAWLNRRLAIELVGLGDQIDRLGLDPRCPSGYETARDLLRDVVEVVHGRSRSIAGDTGTLPALDDPGRALPHGRLWEGWNQRWRAALETHGVRHRNLLVLQPWSLFPRHKPADFRYASLLPLLRHADACSFPAPRDTDHWSLNQFKEFHERACAALQQRDAAHQIAVHV